MSSHEEGLGVDEEAKRLILGYRKANQAALFANVRSLLARAVVDPDPVVGLHGFYLTESGKALLITAGATPPLKEVLGFLGGLQGLLISSAVARMHEDYKTAQSGDQFDPKLGRTRCVGCDDGDPTGDHARKELEENARAWLGLMIIIGELFYGEHLSDGARRLMADLRAEALPADANIS